MKPSVCCGMVGQAWDDPGSASYKGNGTVEGIEQFRRLKLSAGVR
jgi:hypothetical protein